MYHTPSSLLTTQCTAHILHHHMHSRREPLKRHPTRFLYKHIKLLKRPRVHKRQAFETLQTDNKVVQKKIRFQRTEPRLAVRRRCLLKNTLDLPNLLPQCHYLTLQSRTAPLIEKHLILLPSLQHVQSSQIAPLHRTKLSVNERRSNRKYYISSIVVSSLHYPMQCLFREQT